MKQNSETILSAYSAAIAERDTILVPETMTLTVTDLDVPELTDEQIDAIADNTEPSPIWKAGMELLEAIKAEERSKIPFIDEDDFNEREEAIDKGLTTEINRSTSLVSVSDTLDNCLEIIRRNRDWEHAGLFLDRGDEVTPSEPVKVAPSKVVLTDFARKLLARSK